VVKFHRILSSGVGENASMRVSYRRVGGRLHRQTRAMLNAPHYFMAEDGIDSQMHRQTNRRDA